MRRPLDRRLYLRWIVANALAEGVGLGTTLVLVYLGAGRIEGAGPAAIVPSALLAVALGTALEGVLVGWAQGVVLAECEPRIQARRWTVATAVGAGVAWTLGVLPSTVIGLLSEAGGAASGAGGPSRALPLLAGAMGAVLGPVLALAQWRVLAGVAQRAWRWLVANAAAWAAGMVVIFAAMHAVAASSSPAGFVGAVFLACTLAGAVVGAVHGAVLQRMLLGRPAQRACGSRAGRARGEPRSGRDRAARPAWRDRPRDRPLMLRRKQPGGCISRRQAAWSKPAAQPRAPDCPS